MCQLIYMICKKHFTSKKWIKVSSPATRRQLASAIIASSTGLRWLTWISLSLSGGFVHAYLHICITRYFCVDNHVNFLAILSQLLKTHTWSIQHKMNEPLRHSWSGKVAQRLLDQWTHRRLQDWGHRQLVEAQTSFWNVSWSLYGHLQRRWRWTTSGTLLTNKNRSVCVNAQTHSIKRKSCLIQWNRSWSTAPDTYNPIQLWSTFMLVTLMDRWISLIFWELPHK